MSRNTSKITPETTATHTPEEAAAIAFHSLPAETQIAHFSELLNQPRKPSAPFTPIPPVSPLFPEGHLSLLLGQPGTSKSLLALHLAACASQRSALPPFPYLPTHTANPDLVFQDYHEPTHSLICSCEDDLSTINRRLSVATAGNPDRPHANRSFIDVLLYGSFDPYRPRDHFSDLLDKIKSFPRVRLIVLDPLPAILDRVDISNNPASIRDALNPLLEYARAKSIALVGISHLVKSPRRTPGPLSLDFAARSYVYTALARSVMVVAHDPQNPARRYVIPLKNNVNPVNPAYAFTLHQAYPPVKPDPAHPQGPGPNLLSVPYILWDHSPNIQSPFTPNTLNTSPEPTIDPARLQQAVDFLKTVLSHGPISSTQLQKEARSLDISPSSLKRAKDLLHPQVAREPHRNTHRWLLSLPTHEYDI